MPSLIIPGWVLIDRCGKHFGTILNYLRDGTVALPESARDLAELYCEAKYYLISGEHRADELMGSSVEEYLEFFFF